MAFIRIYVTEPEWVMDNGSITKKDVKRYLAEVKIGDGEQGQTTAANIAADMIKRLSRIYRNVESETV